MKSNTIDFLLANLNFVFAGSSSRDSLLSWIRLLEKHDNPILSTIPIIFTLTAPSTDVALQETQPAIEENKSRKAQP